MTVRFSNNAETTLAAGISVGATSFELTNAALFPALNSGEWMYLTIDEEVVRVTAISGTTCTCVATTEAHTSGEGVYLYVTAEMLIDIGQIGQFRSVTVRDNRTLSQNSIYDTGSETRIDKDATLRIPASTRLNVNERYTARGAL